jgi:DNA-binding transcriptional ArsR family regulator
MQVTLMYVVAEGGFSTMGSNSISGAALRQHVDEASRLLTAVGNPVRMMVLYALLDREQSVSELNSRIELSQSALSQHLAVLRRERLVRTRREAQMIYYAISNPNLRSLMDCLYHFYRV